MNYYNNYICAICFSPLNVYTGAIKSAQYSFPMVFWALYSEIGTSNVLPLQRRHILNVALAFLQAMLYLFKFKKLILSCCSWRCTRSHAKHGDQLECSHTKELLLTLSEA